MCRPGTLYKTANRCKSNQDSRCIIQITITMSIADFLRSKVLMEAGGYAVAAEGLYRIFPASFQ